MQYLIPFYKRKLEFQQSAKKIEIRPLFIMLFWCIYTSFFPISVGRALRFARPYAAMRQNEVSGGFHNRDLSPYMGTGGVGFFQIRRRSGGVGGPKNTKVTFFCTNVMNWIRYFISANTKMNMLKLKHKITKKYQ